MLKFPVRSAECGQDGLQFTVGAYKRMRGSCSSSQEEDNIEQEDQDLFSPASLSTSSPPPLIDSQINEDSCTASLLVRLACSDSPQLLQQQQQQQQAAAVAAMAVPFQDAKWRSAIPGRFVDDATKRAYVLELTRRFNLTRRELSVRAGLQQDFRFMNYWLRGKDQQNPQVVQAGQRMYQWAIGCDVRVAVPLSEEEKAMLQAYQEQQLRQHRG